MGYTAIADFTLNFLFGWQTANKVKGNIEAGFAARHSHYLGGSRSASLDLVAAPQDVVDYIDVELDGTPLAGLTVQVRVECRSTDVATSVTPTLRNMTDAVDAGVGVACSAIDADYSGANQVQVIAITLAAGVKKYRLRGTPSDAVNPTFAIGFLEILAP